ncbi:hypothetical protein C8P63_105176 [Melghirimyces profundicolus]|uniref:Uncharacterized protein n=1 Tax=Melghirimyces profundicolus TaxID=1242148 RepID=A0A2T6C2N6_9BACL|nr:hypothetical protein [Melghirimyces profundicolus]PTX62579.1 hypothetical protein C8P63_105176 [Melghirimyces profundicolus]
MISDWLQKIPMGVWVALALILVAIIVLNSRISRKRSQEVEELERAFREPYQPREEGEKGSEEGGSDSKEEGESKEEPEQKKKGS